jgi:hypothetical protein
MKSYLPYSQSGGVVATLVMVTYLLRNAYLQTLILNELWQFW